MEAAHQPHLKVTLPTSCKMSKFFENSQLHFVTTDANFAQIDNKQTTFFLPKNTYFKKIFVATEILVFDFELFIGGRLICHEHLPVFQDTCIGNVAVL